MKPGAKRENSSRETDAKSHMTNKTRKKSIFSTFTKGGARPVFSQLLPRWEKAYVWHGTALAVGASQMVALLLLWRRVILGMRIWLYNKLGWKHVREMSGKSFLSWKGDFGRAEAQITVYLFFFFFKQLCWGLIDRKKLHMFLKFHEFRHMHHLWNFHHNKGYRHTLHVRKFPCVSLFLFHFVYFCGKIQHVIYLPNTYLNIPCSQVNYRHYISISIIHCCQDTETIELSINKWIDKKQWYIHGILFSLEKGENLAI